MKGGLLSMLVLGAAGVAPGALVADLVQPGLDVEVTTPTAIAERSVDKDGPTRGNGAPSPGLAAILSRQTGEGMDWPVYGGGRTRNAVREGKEPARRWNATWDEEQFRPGANIKWMARLGHGFAVAAPVVARGFVWVGTNNERPRDPGRPEPAAVLMCFRESDGAFVWQEVLPIRQGVRADVSFTGVKCSPWVEGERLWYTTPGGEVICLDLGPLYRGEGTPRRLWKLDMTEELGVFLHPMVMGWPGANSVAVLDRWVFVNTDNAVDWTHANVPFPFAPSLVCLEKATGKVVWEDNSPGKDIFHIQWSSPLALELNGEPRVIAGFGDGKLRSFKAATGERLWEVDCNPPEYKKRKYPAAEGPSEILAAPVFHAGRVYVATGQEPEHGEGRGNLVCVDAVSGALLWQNSTVQRSLSSVVVLGEYVYAADFTGNVYGLSAITGKVRWRYDSRAHIWSSPLVVAGLLYIGDEDGDLSVFDLRRVEALVRAEQGVLQLDKWKPIHPLGGVESAAESPPFWVNIMSLPLLAPMSYANEVLYCNASGHLCAIANLTNASARSGPLSRPVQVPDAVFVPTPLDVVKRMLELAQPAATEQVVDLGSGDGRILITAARDFGCRATGWELDPVLVTKSREAVRAQNLETLVQVRQEDLFRADLSQANVVAVFLPPALLQRLLPQLQQLPPGSRVISHDFLIPGVPPARTVQLRSTEDGAQHAIHLYPAPLLGSPSLTPKP